MRSHQMLKSALPCLLLLGLLGCGATTPYIPREQATEKTFALKVDPIEAKRQVGNELGLALSGGGMRAAMFNLGLLKWMYDSKLLDRVDIVSTVSGSSYTAYWLYANHAAGMPTPRFGYASLDESRFSRSVCEVLSTGNFVTYWDIGAAVLNPFDRAHDMYERQLKTTFGLKDHHLTVSDLQGSMQASPHVPYWILNATVVDPQPQQGWADGLFEMTPLLKGNQAFRYSAWQPGQDIWLLEAVAVSGAAVREVIKQHVPNPIAELHRPTIELSDGGHSENLGAVALIRRGVKTVIIGDGEHDPKWDFPAYRNLKSRLKNWNLELSIPELDSYLANLIDNPDGLSPKHGVYKGEVRHTRSGYRGTIYYVKMARSEAAEDILTMGLSPATPQAERKEALKKLAGARINKEYFKHLDSTGVWSKNHAQPITWNCNKAIALDNAQVQDWLRFAMASNDMNVANSKLLRVTRAFGRTAWYSDFPMHTTGDQSFYLRQGLAFIGLGYIQACQLSSQLPVSSQYRELCQVTSSRTPDRSSPAQP